MGSSTDPNDDNWSEQYPALTDIQRDIKKLQQGVKEMCQIMEDMRHQLKAAESTQWPRLFDLQAEIIQAKVQVNTMYKKSRLSWLANIIESCIFIITVFFALVVIRENLVDM